MGKLSTHVLDTTIGKPGSGIAVHLFKIENSSMSLLTQRTTNKDGRCDIGDYYLKQGKDLPNPPFLNKVVIRFQVANPQENYHVPLVVTPWSYSTYRGS